LLLCAKMYWCRRDALVCRRTQHQTVQ
jgi:hypothetical protein